MLLFIHLVWEPSGFQFSPFVLVGRITMFLDKAQFRVLSTAMALPHPCAEEQKPQTETQVFHGHRWLDQR